MAALHKTLRNLIILSVLFKYFRARSSSFVIYEFILQTLFLLHFGM